MMCDTPSKEEQHAAVSLIAFMSLTGGDKFFSVFKEACELLDIHHEKHLGESLMHQAALCNRAKAVEYLISKGCDPNITNMSLKTPLHLTKSYDVAHMLLEAGADINSKDADGETPLDVARREELDELCRLYYAVM